MSSTFGENSKPSASSNDYRDNWELIYGNKEPKKAPKSDKDTIESLRKTVARLERVIGKMTHQMAAKKKEKAVFQSVDELSKGDE